ncbi:MAG: recombinase family protein [Microgenomates group bacterium]
MAKQYTDHLSESVIRGINNALKKGKQLNRTKHGYYKDANGFLRPDDKYWAYIKQAWFMRLDKTGEKEIAEYLNSKKYKMAVGTGGGKHQLCVFDKQMVSRMLKNPIYEGVLSYGENIPRVCILGDFYDFRPMVTPDQFLQVNGGKVGGAFVARRGGTVKADLLRQRVVCGYCGEEMSTGISHHTKQKVNRFYFRCETEGCIFHNKSVRAKVVVNFATDLLKRATIKVEEGYEEYKKEFKVASEEKIKELDSMRRSLSAEESQKEKQALTIRQYILRYEKQRDKRRLVESYEGDLTKMEDRLAEVKGELKRVRYELEISKRIPKTFDEFLELVKIIPQEVEKAKALRQLDFILRKVFLNFTIKDKKVTNYTLNPIFTKVYKLPDVFSSESKRT